MRLVQMIHFLKQKMVPFQGRFGVGLGGNWWLQSGPLPVKKAGAHNSIDREKTTPLTH